MPNEAQFIPLRDAVEQSLRMGGVELLQNPPRMTSFVLDMADKSLPETRLIIKQLDEELLNPLAQISASSDAASLRTAAGRVHDILAHERFVNDELAQTTAHELVAGVARYHGIDFQPPAPRPAQQSSAPTQKQTAPASQKTAVKPAPAPAQQPQTPRAQPTPAPARPTVTQPIQTSATQYSPPPTIPAQPVPPAPQKKSRAGLVVVLISLAVIGGLIAYSVTNSNSGPSSLSSNESTTPSNTSDSEDDWYTTVDASNNISAPYIEEDADTYVKTKTEHGLEITWIVHTKTSDGTCASILYLTNQNSVEKDVDLTVYFQDTAGNDVSSKSFEIPNLAPNETTLVVAEGDYGSVNSRYTFTIYDARKSNATSLRGHLSTSISKQSNSGLTVTLTNVGTTTCHVSWAFSYGVDYDNNTLWNYTYWYDDNGNATYTDIAPGESVDVEYGNDWSGYDTDAATIGYADAS